MVVRIIEFVSVGLSLNLFKIIGINILNNVVVIMLIIIVSVMVVLIIGFWN